jgi:hypothetical protein
MKDGFKIHVLKSTQITQKLLQTVLIGNQNLSGLTSIVSAHNAGVFQLVHQTTRPVIADLQFALYHACPPDPTPPHAPRPQTSDPNHRNLSHR